MKEYSACDLDDIIQKLNGGKIKPIGETNYDREALDFDIMRNDFTDKMLYCPNCGAKMVEPQERSK